MLCSRWECVFLPDSGAFFVNYITTAALAGAGLELIRFPELFFYFVRVRKDVQVEHLLVMYTYSRYEPVIE